MTYFTHPRQEFVKITRMSKLEQICRIFDILLVTERPEDSFLVLLSPTLVYSAPGSGSRNWCKMSSS